MKYPQIEFYKGGYNLVNFEVPEDYGEFIKKIDEDFIVGIKNSVRIILKEFEIRCEFPSLQWDERGGLHSIIIGEGRGAYLNKDTNKWVFKNIDESYQAFAVFNIISEYLNKLNEINKK